VTDVALRVYIQERLAGPIAAPDGAPVRGPAVAWKGRRHAPQHERRCAKAWSPEQIAQRLAVDFPDNNGMRIWDWD